jgi:hypothetical protein
MRLLRPQNEIVLVRRIHAGKVAAQALEQVITDLR